MATDFSPEATHARRQSFRFCALALLAAILVELTVVTVCVVLTAKRTQPSPIARCMERYHLTFDQCDQVENGLRVSLDGVK